MTTKKTIEDLKKELELLEIKKLEIREKRNIEERKKQLQKEINELKYGNLINLGNQLMSGTKKTRTGLKTSIKKYYQNREEKQRKFMEWYNQLTPEQKEKYQKSKYVW